MAAGQCMPECSQLGRNDWPKWVGNRLRCFGRWSNMPGEERQSLAPTKLNMKPGSFHKWSLVCPWVDIWSEWSRMSCWDFLLKWPSSHLQTSWPRLWLSGGISFQSNLGEDHIERGAKTVEGQQHIPNRPGTPHVLAVANQESTTQKG